MSIINNYEFRTEIMVLHAGDNIEKTLEIIRKASHLSEKALDKARTKFKMGEWFTFVTSADAVSVIRELNSVGAVIDKDESSVNMELMHKKLIKHRVLAIVKCVLIFAVILAVGIVIGSKLF